MQSFEILTLNRSSLSLSVFVGVMSLTYLLGPVGDMYCLSNTFRMLVFYATGLKGAPVATSVCIIRTSVCLSLIPPNLKSAIFKV